MLGLLRVAASLRSRPIRHTDRALALSWTRRCASNRAVEADYGHVGHSRFLAEAPPNAKWKQGLDAGGNGSDPVAEDYDSIKGGTGRLSPTSSHLFKLILPLGHLKRGNPRKKSPPTIILLHPSQPLSHASRLILATLAPEMPSISYRGILGIKNDEYEWNDSTDVGDFIRDAARSAKFKICITYPPRDGEEEGEEASIDVEVPTFEDRTRFLRRRLEIVERRRAELEELKRACDNEAHRGARRLAVGGFGILIAYWGAVCKLTFFTEYGWDVMEPITYLSGLSTVICGYLWFLYQGREVSYSSVLDRSVSTRRTALYKARGLDIDLWSELVSEAKSLRREIARIAEDYDEHREKTEEEERERKKLEHEDAEDEQEQEQARSDKKTAKEAHVLTGEKGDKD